MLKESLTYDLIIIGGGPAGLTAAIYAIRKRLEVLLISKDLGGKTNFHLQLPWVERHQIVNGEEIVSRFANEIEYRSSTRVLDKAVAVKRKEDGSFRVTTREEKSFDAGALIVATGARGQLLNVPGEREFMMRGLCYSATSYAPICIEREAVVIGEGDLALRAAAELGRAARRVTLIAATTGQLDTPLGRRVRALPNVLILEGFQVTEVLGDHHHRYARAVVVTDGRSTREVAMDAGFVELALLPNVDLVRGWVELDENDRIVVDGRNRTSCPGVFAAGDVSNVYAEQVLIAVGEGAKAALSAYDYLLEKPVEEKKLAGEWR